jgi:DNA-binding LacI/PurR family transcriptional regulator
MDVQMIRMKDVAKHAGVSVATVSNVLTGKQVVSDSVREAVFSSIKELNYSINLVARGLKTQRTNTIGLILPDVTKLFFLDVLKGIMETATKEKYNINIFSSNFDFEVERLLLNSLLSNRVDGIILDTCMDRQHAAKCIRELSLVGPNAPPVVSLESRMDTEHISSVFVDCKYWSGRITQHLIDCGHKRIFFIAGPVHIEHEYDHLEGYRHTLEQNAIPVQDELVAMGDFLSGTAYDMVYSALEKGLCFDAIQASNDQAAIGAIKALQEHGISVPAEVAVCGFDNLFPSTLVTPAITTVSVPRYEMGVIAVQEILRRIKNRDAAPELYKIDAELIIRASSIMNEKTPWNLNNW